MTTQAAAGYRPGTGYRRCWNCEHFTLPQVPEPGPEAAAPPPTCAVLQAPIEPTAVCDRWVQMADRARKRTGFRSALRRYGEYIWDDGPGGERAPRGGPAGGDPRAGGSGGGPLGL